MSFLLVHEDRLNRSREKVQEKAFQFKWEFANKGKPGNSARRGHGKDNFSGRGRGGNDRAVETKLVNSVSPRDIFNANTIRNVATKKLTVRLSEKMIMMKPISQKMWKKKESYLWLIPQ